MRSADSPLNEVVKAHQDDGWFIEHLQHWNQKIDNAEYLLSFVKPYYHDYSISLFNDIIIRLKYEEVIIELHIGNRRAYIETYDEHGHMVDSMTCYCKNIMEAKTKLITILNCKS